ncbi:MAG: Stp1/IreP family PP2C-type Ser/Thr phosphatase [Acidobacteria bacterium]|nr:Stp1/IreP family PP2C-type Ser/Thr phosphatase [Acidobacteriota bacterium]
MTRNITLSYAAQTHVGRERPHNEDGVAAYSFSSVTNSQAITCGLFVVSDGMGGHNAGEIASMTAIKSMVSAINRDYFQKLVQSRFFRLPDNVYNYHFKKMKPPVPPLPPRRVLPQAIQRANRDIIELSRKNPAFFGMGATITAAIIVDRTLTVASVGDSRCYVIGREQLKQVTRDHTIVNQMLELGTITPEEAKYHPGRNFLYRSLGSDEVMELDVYEEELTPPVWVLLCSDGLNNMVSDEQIQTVIDGARSPERAATRLVRIANRAGGKDNISVVLVKVSW